MMSSPVEGLTTTSARFGGIPAHETDKHYKTKVAPQKEPLTQTREQLLDRKETIKRIQKIVPNVNRVV
jgi:hypothetical protein